MRLIRGETVVHIPDLMEDEGTQEGNLARRTFVKMGGARTQLAVPLRKDNTLTRYDMLPGGDTPTSAELAERLPTLRLRMLGNYAIGRFLHDSTVLSIVDAQVKVRWHLEEFIIGFGVYRAIQEAVFCGKDNLEAERNEILSAVAAEVTEMLASIQMLQKSEIFPIDYVCTSQLLKDNQLGSKVARADVFSDLITNPTGYILKSAPLIYFKRHPDAVVAEMVEVPHRMHFFIAEMARDLPPGVGYVDFTIAAGGLHVIVATSAEQFGRSIPKRVLRGRVGDLISGHLRELRRVTSRVKEPRVLPPRDGTDTAEAVWVQRTQLYGFRLDETGRWRSFIDDVRIYISRDEWEADLKLLFVVMFMDLLPILNEHNVTHIIINPDRSLNLVPIAQLRDSDGNRICDQKRISLIPTLPHFMNALLRVRLDPYRNWTRILMLVDTHSGANHFELEKRLVEDSFRNREVLIHTTGNFDKVSFIRDAANADIVHICAHASFDAQQPRLIPLTQVDRDFVV